MQFCYPAFNGIRQLYPVPLLSQRERECLLWVAKGDTTTGIASRLGISKRTVDHHIANVMTKLGTPTRAAAVGFAVHHALINMDSDA